jgi:peptidoglycan/LPS O-acetylase OafA/YrhL
MRPASGARPQLPALTGLRFVAAALVVLFHARGMLPSLRENAALDVLGSGYSGVSLFFVLSGFVLAYNYLTPDGTGVRDTRDFLVARFARIYPVYLVGIIVGFPLFVRDLQRSGGNAQLWREGPPITGLTVTLLQSWVPDYACRLNCPGWSLSTEAFFYLAFPAIGIWLVRRPRASLIAFAATCWVIAMGFSLTYMKLNPDHFTEITAASRADWIGMVKFSPLFRLPEFALGMAAGVLFLRTPEMLGRYASAIGLLASAAIVAVLTFHARLPYLLIHNGLLAPLFAVLIVALAGGSGPLAVLLGTRPLRLLGEASFALYLMHLAILSYATKGLEMAGKSMNTHPALLIGTLVVMQAISIAILLTIEEPARRVIRSRLGRTKSVAKAETQTQISNEPT